MNRPGVRVTRLMLERRARELKRHLPAAVEGDGIGVHQARVASRRLREALPVLGEDIKGNKPGKALGKVRRLTRALGAVRELDVTLSVLDELVVRDTLPRDALEVVRAHVVEERESRRETMLKRLAKIKVEKLDRRLASVAAALQDAETERWRETLSGRLAKRSKALTAALATAGQMYNPERLHQVRIATKKLRYGLEIAAESGIRSAAAPVRELKRVQDTLGRLHDLQVLELHVAAVRAQPSVRELSDGSLSMVAGALEKECRHLHGRYMSLSPALLATVQGIRTVVADLVRPARRRTLKMALPAKPHRQPAASAPAAAAAARSRH